MSKLLISNLLFDDQPLICQPGLAYLLHSSDKAIMLQQLHYWLQRTNNVQEDGHKWVYNSMDDWLKQFPWLGDRNRVSKYFKELEKLGLVVTGNFNKFKFDRTKWYRIDYDALEKFAEQLHQENPDGDDGNKTPGESVPEADLSNASNPCNGVQENDAKVASKQGNGLLENGASVETNPCTPSQQNSATYTRDYQRLPRDYQENTAESTSENATDGQQVEDPFELASQYRINAEDGEHKSQFLKAIKSLGEPLVCWAIRETANGRYCSWGYLASILARLQRDGIKSVEDAERDKQWHRHQYSGPGKQHVEEALPEWSKKSSGELIEKASPDEVAEVQAMLAERRGSAVNG